MSKCGCTCGDGGVESLRGPQGEKGLAATISVGKVTLGNTASVTNSGTSTDAVFDFVIPRDNSASNQYGVATKVSGQTLTEYLRVSQDDGASWQDIPGAGALETTFGDNLKFTDEGMTEKTRKVSLEVNVENLKGVVKSVNGVEPDDAGAVEIIIPEISDDPTCEGTAADNSVTSCAMVQTLHKMSTEAIEEIRGDLKETNDKVAANADEIIKVKNDIVDIKSSIVVANEKIGELKGEVKNIGDTVDAVKEDVADVKSTVSDIRDEVSKARDEVTEVKAEFTEVKSEFADVKDAFAATKTEVKNEISTFETKVDGEISTVQTDITAVKEDVSDVQKEVDKVKKSAIPVPVGAIMFFATSTAPGDGWLLCDGSAVSRETYSDLFSMIGCLWGDGDKTTTFNLPNGDSQRFVSCTTGDVGYDTASYTKGTTASANVIYLKPWIKAL